MQSDSNFALGFSQGQLFNIHTAHVTLSLASRHTSSTWFAQSLYRPQSEATREHLHVHSLGYFSHALKATFRGSYHHHYEKRDSESSLDMGIPIPRGLLICKLLLPLLYHFPAYGTLMGHVRNLLDRVVDDYGTVDTTTEEDFFHFVTRPDIRALKWNITVYDDTALAPGYWFIAPYALLGQKQRGEA